MCIICPTLSTVFYTFVLVYFSTFKHYHLFATYLPVLGPPNITLGQAWQVLVLQQQQKNWDTLCTEKSCKNSSEQ